jgi:hypothetical protein
MTTNTSLSTNKKLIWLLYEGIKVGFEDYNLVT